MSSNLSLEGSNKNLTKKEAKEKIRALVTYYSANKESFDKQQESDVRNKLIDRLLGMLGWDIGGLDYPDEVQREESIKNEESQKKKADYVFRVYGIPKLVLEAKAIKNVDLNEEKWKEQAIGYSYNLACSWAVLSNFVRTTIFFVDRNDHTPIRDIKDLSDLSNFDKNFESLWLLSKEGVRDELLEKDIEMRGIKPQKDKVGLQLYKDLKDWRDKISKDIRKNYPDYKDYEREEIVQKIIDRLIFIRKLEDIELEDRKLDQLIRKSTGSINYYSELKKIFAYYHEKYNSGLFGDNGNLQACDVIEVGNEAIRAVILGMYKPKETKIEYNFRAIDADVLSNIYEQYLSYILRDTLKKEKLEGGQTHKKEQGIYYTPTYIVDYIVKNTIVPYLKFKSLPEILTTKIIDPACGSGSFLIRAFSEMCKLVEEKMKKGERLKNSPLFNEYHHRLTIQQKITILISCIHGIDLDKKAVEIAQLNLLLRLLEGETPETLSFSKAKKILPMLNDNIKNGNSLIDDISISKDYFKWEEQFKEIVSYDSSGKLKEGYGFDIVIGNPPYIRPEKVPKNEREYYLNSKKYDKLFGRFDLYTVFIERALKINKDEGLFSFIIPSSFLNQNYSKVLREWILKEFILRSLVDLSNVKVFDSAEVQTCIPFIKKTRPATNSSIQISKPDKIESMDNLSFTAVPQKNFLATPQCMIRTDLNDKKSMIINKLSKLDTHFKDIFYTVIGAVPHDSKTGASKDRLIHDKKLNSEYKPYLEGKDVSRYIIKPRGIYLNYQPKMMHRPKFPELFENEKLIIRNISTKEGLLATYDKNNFYTNDTVSLAVSWASLEKLNIKGEAITKKMVQDSKDYKMLYCLALVNSKLINFYFKNVLSSNLHVYPEAIRNLPIKKATETEQKPIIGLVENMLSLKKKLDYLAGKKTSEALKLEEELSKTDILIDQEVYKLYGITKEEQEIIENSLKAK